MKTLLQSALIAVVALTPATAQKANPNRKLNFIRKVFIKPLEGNGGATARERLIVLLANTNRLEVVEDSKLADAIFKERVEFEGQVLSVAKTTSGESGRSMTSVTGTTLLRFTLST